MTAVTVRPPHPVAILSPQSAVSNGMHEYVSWISGVWLVAALGFLVTANHKLNRPEP